MKRPVLAAFVCASLMPGAALTAGSASAQTVCGPDVPEGYKRPGGYCAQITGGGAGGGSINDKSGGSEIVTPTVPCAVSYVLPRKGIRLHVATAPCEPECFADGGFELDMELVGDRVRVAAIVCP